MDILHISKALQNSRLFNKLSLDKLTELLNVIEYGISEHSSGEIIHSEDEECKNLSIIVSGIIEIQKIDILGRILTVAQFSEGSTFGENLIFGDKNRYPMNVISKTDTVLVNIKKENVLKLCEMDRDFMYEFLRAISNRAVILSSKLKEVTLKTIRQKISEFLLMKNSKCNNRMIDIGMTKKEWADKLGVQRPSLSRELIKMKEEGIIDYQKNIIKIIDIDALMEI